MATKKAKTAKTKTPPAARVGKGRMPSKAAASAANGKPARAKSKDAKPAKPKAEQAKLATKNAPPPRREEPSSESSGGGIQVGDHAPSFVLRDDTGHVVSSESLRGSPYVLYFYPKDDTPGCTLEACGFRDAMPRFDAKGVRVLGVSPDDSEAHARFKKKYGLPFPLLSDPEKTLAKSYGVWVMKKNYGREYMGVERSTFYVDRRGTVQRVWRSVRVPGHVDTIIHSV